MKNKNKTRKKKQKTKSKLFYQADGLLRSDEIFYYIIPYFSWA